MVSLYPSAIMLAPLPLGETEWKHVKGDFDPDNEVGFARVKFEFPNKTEYPCLPVMHEWHTRLYFPLKGESWCTLFELAEAQRMGCRLEAIEARFFEPSKREIDHPLKSFIGELLKRKKAPEKGTLEYECTKLMANSIYGKLCQRNPKFEECAWLEYHLHKLGKGMEELPELYRSWKYRKEFIREQSVGPLWNPPWAALITGKARAIMAQLVEKGAMLCATDGIIVDRKADMRCQALRELESIGSGLERKAQGDLLWIGKDRCYAILKEGKVVDGAGHGTQMDRGEFKKFIAERIERGKLARKTWIKQRIGSLKDELAGKGKMGSEIEQEINITVKWDGKRELVRHIENIFTNGSLTKPWSNVTKIELEEGVRRVETTAKKEELLAKIQRIRELHEKYGTPISKACEMVEIPRCTYYRYMLPRT